jgi:hypothetical protein
MKARVVLRLVVVVEEKRVNELEEVFLNFFSAYAVTIYAVRAMPRHTRSCRVHHHVIGDRAIAGSCCTILDRQRPRGTQYLSKWRPTRWSTSGAVASQDGPCPRVTHTP